MLPALPAGIAWITDVWATALAIASPHVRQARRTATAAISGIHCPASCADGQICDKDTRLCKGDPTTCKPGTCSNGTAFNYCGTVGDGCGGSLNCPTDCGAGQVCDTAKSLCKGDPAVCVPITCTAENGGRYCGGAIGDNCGGAITCDAACPTGFACEKNACVCKSTSCGACSGLSCQVVRCDASSTTLSGKVFTPAGANGDPVYNALVFIPNGPLAALPPDGPSCDQCTPLTSDQVVAGDLSGPDGSFVLLSYGQLAKFRRDGRLVWRIGSIQGSDQPALPAIKIVGSPARRGPISVAMSQPVTARAVSMTSFTE